MQQHGRGGSEVPDLERLVDRHGDQQARHVGIEIHRRDGLGVRIEHHHRLIVGLRGVEANHSSALSAHLPRGERIVSDVRQSQGRRRCTYQQVRRRLRMPEHAFGVLGQRERSHLVGVSHIEHAYPAIVRGRSEQARLDRMPSNALRLAAVVSENRQGLLGVKVPQANGVVSRAGRQQVAGS